jgi:hypothetical protein
MPKAKKASEPKKELREVKEFETLTMADFDKMGDKSPPSGAKNIVTTLLGVLGENEAKVFELDWRQYSGLRRHISILGNKALLKAKLQGYRDTPSEGRAYKVAVARA